MGKTLYETVIEKYINGEKDNFSEVRSLGHRKIVLDSIKKYLTKHPESINQINYILDHFDELMNERLPREDFIRVIRSEKFRNTSDFIDITYKLLTLDEEQSLSYLKKKGLIQKELDKILERFKTRFPNQTLELEYFTSLFGKYISNRKEALQTTYASGPFVFSTIHDSKDKFKSLYDSGVSIEEFCSNTGCYVAVMRNDCKNILSKQNDVQKKMAEEILKRDNSKFMVELKNIALSLSQINDFDIIDYYKYTRLSAHDFKKLVEPLIDYDIFRVVNTNVTKAYSKIPKIMSKKTQLESKNIIGGREITREEKEKVFEYLETNNIPITAYFVALRKYLNGEIELPKTYTKKK